MSTRPVRNIQNISEEYSDGRNSKSERGQIEEEKQLFRALRAYIKTENGALVASMLIGYFLAYFGTLVSDLGGRSVEWHCQSRSSHLPFNFKAGVSLVVRND